MMRIMRMTTRITTRMKTTRITMGTMGTIMLGPK